jgi:hypothetical protein
MTQSILQRRLLTGILLYFIGLVAYG